MSCRICHRPLRALLAAVLATALTASTWAQGLPDEKESLSLTNAPRKTRKSLQQLEEELSKSLQSLTPKNSLDGVMAPAPPPRIVVPPRRTQEDERKSTWKLSPDDFAREMNDNDLFKIDGDKSRKQKDPRAKDSIEDLYRQLDSKSPASALFPNRDQDRYSLSGSADNGREGRSDASLPAGVRDSERNLRKALGDEERVGRIFGGDGQPSSFSDFFGLGDRTPSAADLQAHRNYLQEYKNLLDRAAPSSALNPALAGGVTPTVQTLGGDYSVRSTSRTPEVTPGNVNSFLNPQTIPDVNAATLNQWNPLWTPPKPEASKRAAPPVTVKDYPRRKF